MKKFTIHEIKPDGSRRQQSVNANRMTTVQDFANNWQVMPRISVLIIMCDGVVVSQRDAGDDQEWKTFTVGQCGVEVS